MTVFLLFVQQPLAGNRKKGIFIRTSDFFKRKFGAIGKSLYFWGSKLFTNQKVQRV